MELTIGGAETTSNKNFGMLVRYKARELKTTPKKLAKEIGVTDAYIRLIMQGVRTPAPSVLEKLLNALGGCMERSTGVFEWDGHTITTQARRVYAPKLSESITILHWS